MTLLPEPEKLIDQVGDVQIKAILITHKHQDHLNGFHEITGAIGAPVAVHANDVDGLPRTPETVLNDGDTPKLRQSNGKSHLHSRAY